MIFAEITKRNYMSVSVTLKSYFYEVLIPSSQKNTSSPIEDILHHVSISFMKKLALYKSFNPRTHTGCDADTKCLMTLLSSFNPRTHTGCDLDREVLLLVLTSFNPRTHTGCDQRRHSALSKCRRFNPRTHTGCDPDRRQPLSKRT